MAATTKMEVRFMQILIYFTLLSVGFGSKLNTPRLLLPYHSIITSNYTLEVSQGCFKWQSTRPDIASVFPVNGKEETECSASCVVTAASRVASRKTAIVIAEDSVTGQQLRCDVIVDAINDITIETTTQELYLDDSPEEFVIRAQNLEGDVFSSLQGVVFEWNLLPDTESSRHAVPAHNVLRILKFSESNYKAPSYIKEMEDQGKRGDCILVRGIRTGAARVSVKVADPAYKNVKESIVRIIVIANIHLNPPLVYLIPHTTVTYRVELLKQHTIQEIAMPSKQYHLEVLNNTIASLDRDTSTTTALVYGETDVKLKDKHMKLSGTFREPSATVFVVTPGYLEFDVYPGRVWVLETQRTYEIYTYIYDKESHKIHPSKNLRLKATFPEEYFHVFSSSDNGTYHVVKTLQRGFTTVEGLLKAVVHADGTVHDLSPTIEGSQEVEIYDVISVLPRVLVLPWDPLSQAVYQYHLQAQGGSGNYSWMSTNVTVATVSMRGMVVPAGKVGMTMVKVADARNPAHFDTMEVHVLPPGTMEFILSKVEAEIGTTLDLPLAIYSKSGDQKKWPIDVCHKMPLTVEMEDSSIFEYIKVKEREAEGSCASIEVKALTLGHTVVHVTYRYKEIVLSATVTIAAYKPLRAVDPESLALVTPAASKEIVFEGGPQAWILDPSGYYQTVTTEKAELVKMTQVRAYETRKTLHVFNVKCLLLGEQEISLSVGNEATALNMYPASALATVRFACAEPRGLRLIPLVAQPRNLPPCPVSLEFDDPVPVRSYVDLDVLVTITDGQGRKFDNFSSLAIEWNLSDLDLGRFVFDDSCLAQLGEAEGKKLSRCIKSIAMRSKTGQLTVSAAISNYDLKYFDNQNFDLSLTMPIRQSRILNLVNDAQVLPEYLTVYNHASQQHNEKVSLSIEHGSGHFHLTGSEQVGIDYQRKGRDIKVLPGEEGTYVITAHDLCLRCKAPAKATVFVSDVYQIVLNIVDKVELHKQIVAKVQVLDRNNQAIPAVYFNLIDLQPHPESDIISVKVTEVGITDDYTAVYVVDGVSLGRTALRFTALQKSGRMVNSLPREIQVFAPLRLDPRNITLIIGALYQVTAHGGPQPESTIEFSIGNQTVSTVTGTGLVEARSVGSTTVVGKAVGVDADNGVVVYSQDHVTVNVVELDGIKIFVPLKRLQTGTQMPVYAMGINENEAPFSFGSAMPALSFDWSISNQDVADLRPLFYKSGIAPPADSNFAVRFFAEKAGHVTVRLTVTPSPATRVQLRSNAQLTDSVQIQVFERLQILSPGVCDGVFLITQNTEAQIKTNRDGSSARVTYNVIGGDGTLARTKEPVITVSEAGHVTSGPHSGQASLLITSHEDFGVNQSTVLLVKVKPVSYLMVNADTVINTRGPRLAHVPVGTTLHFTVSFHDDVGEIFFAMSSKTEHRPNRFDLLQINYGTNNNTLVARATNIGQTVLKVWDSSNPHLADYVNINVGSAIQPAAATVTLGDVVCFSSPIVGVHGQAGLWYSSSGTLQIEQVNGIALATQVGSSLVSYTITAETLTNTQVTIAPVTRVTLRNEHVQHLTNVLSKNRVNIIPVLLDDGSESSSAVLQGPNCTEVLQEAGYSVWRLPFRCEASMASSHPHIVTEDLLRVVAEFDASTGQYQCRLIQSTSHDLMQDVSTLDTTVQLKVVVSERQGQPEVTSNVLSLPYVPAFYVHTSELQLSNLMPVINLRVSATERVLQDVKVTSRDDSLIKVLAQDRGSQTDYVAHYPIALQLTSNLWERSQLETSIEVRCLATGQSQSVPVQIKLHGEKGAQSQMDTGLGWSQFFLVLGNNYQNIVFMVLCVIATVSCIFIAYHAVIGQRYQTTGNQAAVFMSPGQRSPGSPGSPWSSPQNVSHSPSRLWSVDYGPYEGSGIFKRSPMQQSPSPPRQ